MNVSPRQLRIFVHLAQSLSFGATAEAFGVTQPTLSRILRDLEEELGARLFDRTTRRVALSQRGQELLGVAKHLSDTFDEGLRELEQVAQQRSQRIALAALPTLASLLLPRALMRLRQAHPGMLVHCQDVYAESAVELLRSRTVDIALSSLVPDHDDLDLEAITEEGFVLLATRQQYETLDLTRWSSEGIGGLPIVAMCRGTGTRSCVDAAFRLKGLTFRPHVEFQHLSVIADFVRSGYGVTILPMSSARMMRDAHMVAVPLADVPRRSIAIITRKGYRPGRAVRSFLDEIATGLSALNA